MVKFKSQTHGLQSNLTNGTLAISRVMNSSQDEFWIPSGPPLWDTIFLGVIGTLSLIGNAHVIFLISTRRKIQKQASPNWFVLSLAVADFCVGGLYAPSRFICNFAVHCTYVAWNIIIYFQSVFLTSSVTNLCVLTLDRYLAVVHPYTYHSIRRSSRVFHLIQSAWWIAVLLNVPFLVTAFLPRVSQTAYFVHSVAYMVLFAFLPSAFMIYAYIAIVIVIRRHRKDITRLEQQVAANFSQESKANQRGNHTRDGTMKAVGVIVLIFIICSTLFQWLTICSLGESCDTAELLESHAYFIIFTLLHFKSAINVVVYALLRRDFQTELRKIYKCR